VAPTERINVTTRVIALSREQKPRVEMNPAPRSIIKGEAEIRFRRRSPYKCRGSPASFFLPLRATTILVSVLKGLAVSRFSPAEVNFATRKFPSYFTLTTLTPA